MKEPSPRLPEREKAAQKYAEIAEGVFNKSGILPHVVKALKATAEEGFSAGIRWADEFEIRDQQELLSASQAREQKLREALELIKNGGVPNGVLATVEERMIAMCDLAAEALSGSGDQGK